MAVSLTGRILAVASLTSKDRMASVAFEMEEGRGLATIVAPVVVHGPDGVCLLAAG